MSEHREKAVKALADGFFAAQRDAGLATGEVSDLSMGAALQAAEPHLQRMYWERFREAVLSKEAVEAVIHHRHPSISLQTLAFKKEVVDDACGDLETALAKAQDLITKGADDGK